MSKVYATACKRLSGLRGRLAAAAAAVIVAAPSASFAQWTTLGLTGVDFTFMTDIDFATSTTGYLVGWEGGQLGVILKTSNGGSGWERTDVEGAQLQGVKFLDAETGIAVGYNYGCKCGLLLRTTDGGENWSSTTHSDVAGLQSVEVVSDNLIYVTGGAGVVLKSTDRGATWTKSGTEAGGQFRVTQFLNSSTGFAVASSGGEFGLTETAYRTTDGGAGWEVIFSEENASALDVFFTSPQTGFVAGGFINGDLFLPVLYGTTDGGSTWKRVWTGSLSPSFIQDIYFITPQIGFAVGDNGMVLTTTNGGTTWDPEFPSTSNSLKAMDFVDGILYATGDLGTLISREVNVPKPTALFSMEELDFGDVGPQESRTLSVTISAGNGLPLTIDTIYVAEGGGAKGFTLLAPQANLFPIIIPAGASQQIDVRFAPPTLGSAESNLIVRSNDAEISRRSLPLTGEGTSVSGVYAREEMKGGELSIVPNPMALNGEVVVRFPGRGKLVVSLYDLLGKRIALLYEGNAEGGEKRIPFDCSSLLPGLYVCVVEGSSGRMERSVIVAP